MKKEKRIEELLDDDIIGKMIGKMYNNELFLSEEIVHNEEYENFAKKNNNISRYIIENTDINIREKFVEYSEQVAILEGIDAEEQFKLGFKTAVKLIIEGLK